MKNKYIYTLYPVHEEHIFLQNDRKVKTKKNILKTLERSCLSNKSDPTGLCLPFVFKRLKSERKDALLY